MNRTELSQNVSAPAANSPNNSFKSVLFCCKCVHFSFFPMCVFVDMGWIRKISYRGFKGHRRVFISLFSASKLCVTKMYVIHMLVCAHVYICGGSLSVWPCPTEFPDQELQLIAVWLQKEAKIQSWRENIWEVKKRNDGWKWKIFWR